MASAVEEHLGVAATARGLFLRVEAAKVAHISAALHNEKGRERALFRVSGFPPAVDRAEVQEGLQDFGWPTRTRGGFREKNSQMLAPRSTVRLGRRFSSLATSVFQPRLTSASGCVMALPLPAAALLTSREATRTTPMRVMRT